MAHIQLKNGKCSRAKLIEYPDGQISWQLDLDYFKTCKDPIKITCNICEFKDWEKLLALLSALYINDVVIGEIRFAYVMGCRSDRIFNAGEPQYLRDVVCKLLHIVRQYCSNLSFLEPHGRSRNFFNGHTFYHKTPEEFAEYQCVAADKSAVDIAYCLSSHSFGYGDSPYFVKHRVIDDMGLRRIEMTLTPENMDKMRRKENPILICDDLCDGGGTFIAIGKILKEMFPTRKHYLFIYHGLFTAGVEQLFQYYDRIYVTNSYKDYADQRLKVIDVWT